MRACISILELSRNENFSVEEYESMLASAGGCIWSLCVGHVENKRKAGSALPALLKVLGNTTCKAVIASCTMALWSACYGIEENQKLVLQHGGIEILSTYSVIAF